MIDSWITTTFEIAAMVVLSAVGIYVALIVLTRIGGLRSFSKMSSFDFAMTVAVGSLLATTIVSEDPPLLQAVVALAALYAIQIGVAIVRQRSAAVRALVDNRPILLMAGPRVLHDNLRRARVTEADLRSQLRAANVLALQQVRAVVMETTGDIYVLHTSDPAQQVEPELLAGVRGSEELLTE